MSIPVITVIGQTWNNVNISFNWFSYHYLGINTVYYGSKFEPRFSVSIKMSLQMIHYFHLLLKYSASKSEKWSLFQIWKQQSGAQLNSNFGRVVLQTLNKLFKCYMHVFVLICLASVYSCVFIVFISALMSCHRLNLSKHLRYCIDVIYPVNKLSTI